MYISISNKLIKKTITKELLLLLTCNSLRFKPMSTDCKQYIDFNIFSTLLLKRSIYKPLHFNNSSILQN